MGEEDGGCAEDGDKGTDNADTGSTRVLEYSSAADTLTQSGARQTKDDRARHNESTVCVTHTSHFICDIKVS